MSDMTDFEDIPRRPQRSPQGVNWLAVALCPLVFWLLRGDTVSLVTGLFLIGIFGLAAHMLISALEDEEIGDLRPHSYPRKMVGSVLIGFGVTILALLKSNFILMSVGFGAIGFALSIVAFGTDQGLRLTLRGSKKMSKDTLRLVETTERVLLAIPLRVAEVDDEPTSLQAQAFRDTMLQLLSRHPDVIEDLAGELQHVVSEAAEATDAFVEDYLEDPDVRTKRRYMLLLRNLAEVFNGCVDEVRADIAQPEVDDARLFDDMTMKHAA